MAATVTEAELLARLPLPLSLSLSLALPLILPLPLPVWSALRNGGAVSGPDSAWPGSYSPGS